MSNKIEVDRDLLELVERNLFYAKLAEPVQEKLRSLLASHIVEADGMVRPSTLHQCESDELSPAYLALCHENDRLLRIISEHQNQGEPVTDDGGRQSLIAYGRSCGLDEAATVCSRMAYDTYYPSGSRFKHFVPKAQGQMGNLLIKAANAIASLPDGPYDRFKARQQKKAGTSAVA